MAKNFKYGIAASVIAVTIATAGVTTVTSFTFVPEAQAFSIKKTFKKTVKKVGEKTGLGPVVTNTKAGIIWGVKDRIRVVRKKGRTVRKYAKCLTKRNCGRIGDLPRGTKGFNTHDHRTKTVVHDHRTTQTN